MKDFSSFEDLSQRSQGRRGQHHTWGLMPILTSFDLSRSNQKLYRVSRTSVLFRERQTDSQLAGLQEQAGECRATEGQKQAEAICLLAKLWGFFAFKMFPFPLASFSFLKHACDAQSLSCV